MIRAVFIFYLIHDEDLTDTAISGKLLVELQIGVHSRPEGVTMATAIQLDVDADIQDISTLAVYLLKKVEDLTFEIEQRCQTLGANGVLQLVERDRHLLGLVTAYEEVLSAIGYEA